MLLRTHFGLVHRLAELDDWACQMRNDAPVLAIELQFEVSIGPTSITTVVPRVSFNFLSQLPKRLTSSHSESPLANIPLCESHRPVLVLEADS